MDIQWVATLIIALIGAVIALVGGFRYHSLEWVVIGVVIAIIGLAFRPRGKQQ